MTSSRIGFPNCAFFILLYAATTAAAAQEASVSPWVMSTATKEWVRAIAPGVHSVRADEDFIYVESAGLSLHSFGSLEANQYDAPLGPRKLTFRIPLAPASRRRFALEYAARNHRRVRNRRPDL